MARKKIALSYDVTRSEDAAAAEVITPGHLVTLNSSGLIIKHASAAGDAVRMFALEREEMGKGIADTYAIGDTVKVGVFPGGGRVYAIIASGQNIALGAYLESAGNGTLKVTSAATGRLGQALEAVNNSAGPGDARIRVQIV